MAFAFSNAIYPSIIFNSGFLATSANRPGLFIFDYSADVFLIPDLILEIFWVWNESLISKLTQLTQ